MVGHSNVRLRTPSSDTRSHESSSIKKIFLSSRKDLSGCQNGQKDMLFSLLTSTLQQTSTTIGEQQKHRLIQQRHGVFFHPEPLGSLHVSRWCEMVSCRSRMRTVRRVWLTMSPGWRSAQYASRSRLTRLSNELGSPYLLWKAQSKKLKIPGIHEIKHLWIPLLWCFYGVWNVGKLPWSTTS